MTKLEHLQQNCDTLNAQNLSKVFAGDYQDTCVVTPNGNHKDIWDVSTGDSNCDYYYPACDS